VFARLGQRRTTLILAVLASITLITFDLRGNAIINSARGSASDLFAPVQRVVSTVVRPIENVWHGAFDYDNVKRQRDALQDQVDSQQGASLAAEAQLRDYDELRNLVALPNPSGISSVVAQLSSSSLSNFDQTIEINQGSSKGIRIGMPVINGAGLIGRIAGVSPNSAKVRLITDPNFAMAVKITAGPNNRPPPPPTTAPAPTTAASSPPGSESATRSGTASNRNGSGAVATTTSTAPTTTVPTTTTTLGELERGIVSGQGTGKTLVVDEIGVNSGVKVGDIVSTSGVSQSLAPADLPVGTVTEAKRRPGSLYLDVRVKPAADLSRLNFVKVLLYCSDCGS
jgi:rod shape-determining protein MreC